MTCSMKVRAGALGAAAAAVLLAGCNKKDEAPVAPEAPKPAAEAAAETPVMPEVKPVVKHDPAEVAVTVNETKMTWGDLDARADAFLKEQTGGNPDAIPADRMEEARDYFRRRVVQISVFKALMQGEAKRRSLELTDADRAEGLKKVEEAVKPRGMTVEDFFAKAPMGAEAARKEFDEGLLIDKLIKMEVVDGIKIDEAAVLKQVEELAAARVERRKLIEDLRKQALDGGDFAKLAEAHSDCPSGKQAGGSLGSFGRGQMVKAFEDAAFAQEIGKVGDIVETQFGYHVIKVTAKNPAVEKTDKEEAKPETVEASHILVKVDPPKTREQIEEGLKSSSYREGITAFFNKLKEGATIKTPFEDMTF